MRIKREFSRILGEEEGKTIFEMNFFADEFAIALERKSILIREEDDEVFYHNLQWFLQQNYIFQHSYSRKEKDKLVWLSDQTCDLENEEDVKKVPRLILTQKDHSIEFTWKHPILEDLQIKRDDAFIVFSPSGNGYFSKNIGTENTLQNDIIYVFQKTLLSQKIEEDKTYRKEDVHGN